MQKAGGGSEEGPELETEFGRGHLNLIEHGTHGKVIKKLERFPFHKAGPDNSYIPLKYQLRRQRKREESEHHTRGSDSGKQVTEREAGNPG